MIRAVLAPFAWSIGALAACAAFVGGCAAGPPEEEDATEVGEQALIDHRVDGLEALTPAPRFVTRSAMSGIFGGAVRPGRKLVAIRSLELDGVAARLVIDAESLESALVRLDALTDAGRPATPADALDRTPYVMSLAAVAASGAALERVDDDAPTAGAEEPFALTVDMCQSRKPWEGRLFEWAVNLSNETHKPVPIGIAMTGGWAKAYPTQLDQLLAWQRAGKLQITWINHSATHPLHCEDASCRRAKFLTAASVDFDAEVLGLERALLTRGLLPSPIFRFPGLTHDATRLAQLSRLSLMALDADAWIAKGQPIRAGSVVLVHGNGNEPQGIDGFLRAVRDPARAAGLRTGRSALVSPLLVAPEPPR